MTGRPRSVTDEAIFDAVADVVTESGPAGLTLAAVARRVGLSAPALAQRFGSKRALLVAFATNEAGGVAAVFQAARRAAPDPVRAVRDALVSLAGPIKTPEGLANNLAFLQMDLTDPELRAHSVAQSRALRAEVAALLAEAAEGGDLTSAQPEILADTLYATYCGALVTWAIDGTGPLPEWLAERLDRVLDPYRSPS
ncbi:TetR/AcrR family transcriptional regulator [Nonomuraea sp. SYSU D8015]|uniref:TetR/AcrR family transcriptional regulator n=1 Tax=Nonomuraea sp. SYSU D8015 TaxID=2593644 RepID=UPI001660BEBE|nr:TetR/AcrR family transcriptional regulator [Nonomuraea sp. SYSU D8015]